MERTGQTTDAWETLLCRVRSKQPPELVLVSPPQLPSRGGRGGERGGLLFMQSYPILLEHCSAEMHIRETPTPVNLGFASLIYQGVLSIKSLKRSNATFADQTIRRGKGR